MGAMICVGVPIFSNSCAVFSSQAVGIMIFTILLSLTQFGLRGHDFLMNGVAVVLVVVVGYFVGLTYAWGHFVFHVDE